MKIRELGAGRRPAELANPPDPEPMFKDGRGRAGRLDQEPAGLEVPEDNEGGPKLGPGPGLESRPGIVKAFILALISSAFAFMFDFLKIYVSLSTPYVTNVIVILLENSD